ncbi:hypothetical protein Vadar_003654 [Vaccinium darrowii]|uniref:Uncharacterized protein n=1 Tax=Vaccinium darrowii TaxID=229202 RepID=A0ACB7YBB2_9ERIC|nr:hypothetical protein Vadar_003654 [Vaccinium darrowii]
MIHFFLEKLRLVVLPTSGRFWRSMQLNPWLPRDNNFTPLEVADFARDFKVSHFIDSNNNNWKEDLLREAFSSDDADLILSIPISRYEKKDRAVWHFTGHGIYSVKSGYETALTLRRNGQLGMRSTGEGIVDGAPINSSPIDRLNHFLYISAPNAPNYLFLALWLSDSGNPHVDETNHLGIFGHFICYEIQSDGNFIRSLMNKEIQLLHSY